VTSTFSPLATLPTLSTPLRLPALQAWWTSPSLTQHRQLVLQHAKTLGSLNPQQAQELKLIEEAGDKLPAANAFELVRNHKIDALLKSIKPKSQGARYYTDRTERLWTQQLPFILNWMDQALITVNARKAPNRFGIDTSTFAAACRLERGALSVLLASSKWKEIARAYQDSFRDENIPVGNPLFTDEVLEVVKNEAQKKASAPFTLTFNKSLRAETFVPSRFAADAPQVQGALFCYPGIGRLGYSDLPSLFPAASILSDLREADGPKRIVNHQAAKLFATGLSWPHHGGGDQDLPLEELITTIDAHANSVENNTLPKIALGRSFGGSTLLDYILAHPQTFASAFIVSAYSPAFTNFVLASLGNEAREFNYPGWKWVLELDGYFEGDTPESLSPEVFQAMQDAAKKTSTAAYWKAKAAHSQWKIPKKLEARLSELRKLDPNIDELWKRDWSLETEDETRAREEKLKALRTEAGFDEIKTEVTLLWGTNDDQYPQGVNNENPLFTTRSFYQALSIAFGFKLLPYCGGHDPFNTRTTNQRVREEVIATLRAKVRESVDSSTLSSSRTRGPSN